MRRIAWLTDIHLNFLEPSALGVLEDRLRQAAPDAILLGGDIGEAPQLPAYLRGIAVKDFVWAKDAKGAWKPKWTPLGEGMVQLPEFFAKVVSSSFAGPLQLHFEYPLGGPEATIPAMKRDLATLHTYLGRAVS